MSKRLPLERQIRTLPNGMKVILMHKEDFSKSLFMIGIPAGGTNITDQINGQIIKHPMGKMSRTRWQESVPRPMPVPAMMKPVTTSGRMPIPLNP